MKSGERSTSLFGETTCPSSKTSLPIEKSSFSSILPLVRSPFSKSTHSCLKPESSSKA